MYFMTSTLIVHYLVSFYPSLTFSFLCSDKTRVYIVLDGTDQVLLQFQIGDESECLKKTILTSNVRLLQGFCFLKAGSKHVEVCEEGSDQ